MANSNLQAAKKAKNDEFYTMYEDIEREMNAYIEYDKDVFRDKIILLPCDDPEWSNFTKYFAANFERLGLKKLISTSYAKSSGNQNISKFEQESPKFDAEKNKTHGKVFVLERDKNKSGRVDYEDIEFEYLEGDGDFRSEEVTKLRDEADIIITNPPFSLFREFLAWIKPEKKKFAIIGNKNSITYKEVFPLIKNNLIWLGTSSANTFNTPEGQTKKVAGLTRWFTNLDHGLRHEPLQLMTMEDNLKYNKKLIKKLPKDENGKPYYPKYDNYDAIECPCVDGIPSDYVEELGVPITYLAKHSNEQYEIIGCSESEGEGFSNGLFDNSFNIKQPLITRERERENASLQTNLHQEETVESSGYQSLSSISSALNNLKSSDSQQEILEQQNYTEISNTHLTEMTEEDAVLQTEIDNTQESSSNIRCNGIIGVPITFLDYYSSEQFEIIGCADANVLPKGWRGASRRIVEDYYRQGNKGQISEGWRNPIYYDAEGVVTTPYKRILIKHKRR